MAATVQRSTYITITSTKGTGTERVCCVVLCCCVWVSVCVRLADGSAGGHPEPRCRRHKKKGRKCICRQHRMRC